MQPNHKPERGNHGSAKDLVRILLIDDDPDHTNLLREYLNEASGPGFRFELTSEDRLNAGLHRLAAAVYDVVILGLFLPDSHGLDTFFKLQSQSPGVPVVVLTDVRHEATALEAMRRGAQDYLVKGTLDARLLKHVIRYSMTESNLEHAVQHIPSAKLEPKLN